MYWLKQVQEPKYWLLAIAAALVTLHLTVLYQADDSEALSMSILFWLTITSLVWDKQEDLKLDSGIFSSCLGVFIISFVLVRSASPEGYQPSICPFLSLLGLCLLASGVKQLRDYWKELLIISLLIFSPLLAYLLKAIDLATLTAQFSTFSLWLIGTGAEREGVFVIIPRSLFMNGGKVEVFGACSGIGNIIQMFSIGILFLLMIPLNKVQKIICMGIAVLLGFIINALRVSLLAIFVASSEMDAFDYWHKDGGSLIFSILSVSLFGVFCWLLFLRNPPVESDAGGK
ncbi:MAG: cyanoexosortase A [Moorea sp. SIO2B7]|nr:cyanoexosortase A [Moorena sp. SIO2B7]